jgi:hypothetical protein
VISCTACGTGPKSKSLQHTDAQVSVEVITRGVKDRKQSSGLAIVKFKRESDALECLTKWEKKVLSERPIWVSRCVWT